MIGGASSPLEAIATAVYALLVGPPAFTTLAPVFNAVPQGTLPPYAIIENFTEVPWNTMNEFGHRCTFQLHVVSQAAGDQEGLRIQNAARAVLDYAILTVSGFRFVQCKFESGDHWKEEPIAGVITRHHVNIYRVDVTQNS